MPYLFSFGAALSLLFFALLMAMERKKTEHYFLAAIFLMASINAGYLVLHFNAGGFVHIPILTELHLAMPVLYGTMVYFYTRISMQADFRLKQKHLIHLGVFFFYLSFVSWRIHTDGSVDDWLRRIIGGFKPIVNVVYLVATLHLLSKLPREKTDFGKQPSMQKWLLWLTIGGLLMCGISLVGAILNYIDPDIAPWSGDYVIGGFLAFYFFMLGFIAFQNMNIFKRKWNVVSKRAKVSDLHDQSIQYPDDEGAKAFNRLRRFMIEEKPYLDAQLSLHKLSELQGIPISKLSRLINQYAQLNFYDFVNAYRVEEVKAKLADEQYRHLSLVGIALECGFNSKASFNRSFKKLTGSTPSAFRQELLKAK